MQPQPQPTAEPLRIKCVAFRGGPEISHEEAAKLSKSDVLARNSGSFGRRLAELADPGAKKMIAEQLATSVKLLATRTRQFDRGRDDQARLKPAPDRLVEALVENSRLIAERNEWTRLDIESRDRQAVAIERHSELMGRWLELDEQGDSSKRGPDQAGPDDRDSDTRNPARP